MHFRFFRARYTGQMSERKQSKTRAICSFSRAMQWYITLGGGSPGFVFPHLFFFFFFFFHAFSPFRARYTGQMSERKQSKTRAICSFSRAMQWYITLGGGSPGLSINEGCSQRDHPSFPSDYFPLNSLS
jgi:hypothetical protein